MALFEIDPQLLPNLKLGLHSFQIILGFLAWCLEIAVFRGDTSRIVGLNGWTFAVVSLRTQVLSSHGEKNSVADFVAPLLFAVLPVHPRMDLSYHDPSIRTYS